MNPAGVRRSGGSPPVLAVGLALLAAMALMLTVTLMAGGHLSLNIWFFRIRATDVARPLLIGAASALALLWHGRRHNRTRTVGLALLAFTGMLALIALARHGSRDPETGDLGVIEAYVHQAMRGELLLGPYSRYQWHHPGPLYFYLLVPFYRLSEFRTAGLWAGALAINLASMTTMAWTAFRTGSRALAVTITALCLAYVWPINSLMTSQWNPHVLILPTLALMVLCAAIASGRYVLLPLAALFGTFVVQTHVGLVPTVAAVLGSATLVACLEAVRSPHGEERHRRWVVINATLWVLAILWFLPLAEELTRRPGNLTRVWQFFMANRSAGQPFGTAFSVWADMLAPFVRPGFALGWGGPIRGSHPVWTRVWAIVQLALLCAVAVRAVRDGRRFHASLAALIVVASLTALWSVTQIKGELIFDHEAFWITGLGVLSLAVLAESAIGMAASRVVRAPGWALAIACVALLALAADIGVKRFLVLNARSFAPRQDQRAAKTLASEIQKFMRDRQMTKIRLEIDGAAWDIAAGVIVELEKSRVSFAVAPDRVWMFGDALAPTGEEGAAVMISTVTRHQELLSQPGSVNLAQQLGYFADVVTLGSPER